MSDDAAAGPAVPASAASLQPPRMLGPDQLPALRAARAVLKQQLKDSTKEIRKEAGAILIIVGDMSAVRHTCQQTMAT